MSTGRRSCETLEVHPPLRLTEASRCRQPPYGRDPPQSKPRGAPSSAAHGMALGWRSLASCAVLPGETRRRWPRSCCARAPGGTVACARSAPGVAGDGSTKTSRAPSPGGCPSACPGCRAPEAPYATKRPGPMAGAARAGAVPRSPRRARPNPAARGRQHPGAAGSTSEAGGGHGRSGWPTRRPPHGGSVWPAGGCLTPPCQRMRSWAVRMHARCPCGRRSGPPGGRKGPRQRGGRQATMRSTLWLGRGISPPVHGAMASALAHTPGAGATS